MAPLNWAPRSTLTMVGEKGFDHGFADVGSAEGVDAGAEAVPLLEELVEEGGDDELYYVEEADVGAQVFGLAIETREDVYVGSGLAQGDDECEDCWVDG